MLFNRCLQLVEGDQMIFFNIMYDLTRKQPAMVQHCIDAKRLHTLERGRYTWCDFPRSLAYEHWYVKIDYVFEQFEPNGWLQLCKREHRWNPKFKAILRLTDFDSTWTRDWNECTMVRHTKTHSLWFNLFIFNLKIVSMRLENRSCSSTDERLCLILI